MGETVAPILVHYSEQNPLDKVLCCVVVCAALLLTIQNIYFNGLHSVQTARRNKGLKSELLTQIAI